VVCMERFDAAAALAAMRTHGVTPLTVGADHAHPVAAAEPGRARRPDPGPPGGLHLRAPARRRSLDTWPGGGRSCTSTTGPGDTGTPISRRRDPVRLALSAARCQEHVSTSAARTARAARRAGGPGVLRGTRRPGLPQRRRR
jgi:hypothetical protein